MAADHVPAGALQQPAATAAEAAAELEAMQVMKYSQYHRPFCLQEWFFIRFDAGKQHI